MSNNYNPVDYGNSNKNKGRDIEYCPYYQCGRPVNTRSKFCDNHETRCRHCQKRMSRQHQYCPDHECKADLCPDPRPSNLSQTQPDNSFKYCLGHKCTLRDCDNKREQQSDFCNHHRCSILKCKLPCSLIKGSTYCAFHECYEELCSEEAVWKEGSRYCRKTHKCVIQ